MQARRNNIEILWSVVSGARVGLRCPRSLKIDFDEPSFGALSQHVLTLNMERPTAIKPHSQVRRSFSINPDALGHPRKLAKCPLKVRFGNPAPHGHLQASRLDDNI